MNSKNVQEQYNSMSFFYSVLYSGFDLRDYENEFLDEYKDLLAALQPNAKVLDSSCGNGIQATALKRCGIDVTATDISEEMINLTKQYALDNHFSFPTEQLSWEQLPDHYGEDFDIVFCYGNSICHSANKDEMLKNIQSLYRVTKKGGKIVLDTRNWDKILKDAVRFHTSNVMEYDGKKYISTYIWNLGDFDERSNVEILFTEIIKDKETSIIPFKLDFTPFKRDDFVHLINTCNLKIIKDTFQPDKGYYSLTLEK
jgi:2-polyprenyl-3-methyl-5-hydroxy-6-metoxy-1,4-benzoquinol methylase